jgi:hypothetical protein
MTLLLETAAGNSQEKVLNYFLHTALLDFHKQIQLCFHGDYYHTGPHGCNDSLGFIEHS